MSSNPTDENGDGRAIHPAAKSADGFMVVGLGASAGGIRALKEFLKHVPPGSGMAYVVILHLSPEHDSRLAEVLQAGTPMPVTQVTERVKIKPDHVYVIPPNRSLSMSDGSLVLSDVTRVEERRAPVDIFFRTLGDSHGANAACVVLSGTGANGSMGLKRVKERGGIAVVQEPKEAEYADMPRNSIATGLVDYILPVAEMPERLVAYRDSLSAISKVETGEEGRPRRDRDEEQALATVLSQLRLRTGHDFTAYKRGTVRRRIERRIGVTQVADLPAYAQFIRKNPQESRALLKDLLISVTNFFRDPEAFAALKQAVIPKLFENKGVGGHIRVWVPGCATGEEAYSVAMLLAEHAETLPFQPSIQVFASDIDEQAIQTARAGLYTVNDVADVSPERLRRFFTNVGDGYGVRRELREMVLFAKHDLLKDPPFSHLDLISCRNLLIYLNTSGQAKAMALFHFAMNPGGYLFLGGSETVGDHSDLFVAVDKGGHIFQGREVVPRPGSHERPLTLLWSGGPAQSPEEVRREARAQERLSYLDLHRRLLELYAPPSVLVNAEHEIVHLSESAGRFLQMPGGEPTYNLLTVARPELRLELRGALFHAARHRTNVEVPGLPVRLGERTETVNLVVRPVVRGDDTARGFFLVIFEPTPERAADGAEDKVLRGVEPVARQLEEEVLQLRSQLRSHTEQSEIQHEELLASNEELQAINEELRSTAEELETSKEELQSANEELTTINQELKNKIEELSQSNNDLQNLMNSTDIGTVFLDRALRVKLFTPRARDIFNLIPADVGRPLADINSKLEDDGLVGDAEQVLERLHTVEREVSARGAGWFLMRLLPYRTSEDRIEGVVVTFLDITRRMRAEESLREAREGLEFALEAASLGAWDVDLVTGRARTSLRHSQIFGYAEQVASWGPDQFRRHILPEDLGTFDRAFERATKTGTLDFQARVVWPDGSVHWVHDIGRVLYDDAGRPVRMAGVTVDVTDRNEAHGLLLASEDRIRLLLDSIEDYAIFTTDARGRITSWNAGAERILGFTAEDAVGLHSEVTFTPEDRARGAVEAEMETARAAGRAMDERWHVRKDGSRFYASGVLSQLGDAPDSGFVKIMRDLTQQKRAEEELRRAHDELEHRVAERTEELRRTVEAMLAEVKERRAAEERARALVGQLVTAQEDERRRISRDLHDQLGQQLTALRLKLAAMREECDQDEVARGRIEEVQALAESLDSEVDFLTWELRPTALDDLGLTAALTNFVKEWSSHYHIPAEFHSTGFGTSELRLAPQAETCLYRITQEALNNVYKHAQAARVSVILERRGPDAVLVIEDDGVGFDASEAQGWEGGRGLGLVGMRERAALLGGTVELESEPGKGTTIFARVPADGRPQMRGGDSGE
jgi:two-component system CheB/CheR fusion protein